MKKFFLTLFFSSMGTFVIWKFQPALLGPILGLVSGGDRQGYASSAKNYEFTKAEFRKLRQIVSATGTVTLETGAEVKIGSRVSGQLEQLLVKIGDYVKAGEVIAVVEHFDLDARVAQKKAELSLADLKLELSTCNLPKSSFKASLINKDEAIIAEIKKASPSAGIIVEDFDPVQKAKDYEAFGASALSILTEEDFFMGSIQHLKDVKATTSLPILRKDFMIDEYQIYESKLIGADCILLIASILSDQQIKDFTEVAEKLELDYLIEVHDEEELRRIENFENALIGVNNRNLNTFEVDINNSVKLKASFKGKNIFISESGIKSRKNLIYLQARKLHGNYLNLFSSFPLD